MNDHAMDSIGELDDLWDFNDPAGSEARFREWIAHLPLSASDSERAEAQTQLARAQGLQRRFANAHATLDSLESRLAQLSERVQVRYHMERGRVFNSAGAPQQAQPLFLTAWEQARATGEDALAVDAAHMLAIVATGEDAMVWNLCALDLAQFSTEPRAQRWQASLYNNIGWSYFDAGRYPDALAMFERALERRRMDGAEKEIGVAQWRIGRTLRALGRLNEALTLQQSLLASISEDGYVSEEVGELLLALGHADEARPHFRRAAGLLSRDAWLAEREPERLARIRQLGADTAAAEDS